MHAQKLLIGNWKMNLTIDESVALARALIVGEVEKMSDAQIQIVICPPTIHISRISLVLNAVMDMAAGHLFDYGAQDCHYAESGAYTGDTSAKMLAGSDVKWVILGHSERREHHGETDEIIEKKIYAALAAGLAPIVCIGESEAVHAQGMEATKDHLRAQLTRLTGLADKIVVAYEPIWAIGTGKTAEPAYIAEVNAFLRELMPTTPLLYGGSVTPRNSDELAAVPELQGFLVGSASLDANQFLALFDSLAK